MLHGSHSTCIDLRSNEQGRAVIKCASGVGMHVDRTA